MATAPTLSELLDTARVVSIPTRTRFRGISEREAVIFTGPQGASEFSPFLEYDDAESARWLAAAMEFGWERPPLPHRKAIAVNATVPAVPAGAVPEILARFPGCRTAKVKVAERGQALADDVARVQAVREALGPDGAVRVDANGGWTVAEAFAALARLAPFGLEYAEQPCASVAELAELRTLLASAGIAVRIAADESVRKAEDPLAVARAGAADLIVAKAQPLGGIAGALRIIKEARLPVIVSSALDTSVGISMGLHLAAALPNHLLAGACGLGTVALLEGDVAVAPLIPVDGKLPLTRPTLDSAAIDRFAAPPERTRWWRDRIERCYEALDPVGLPS
ncbi:o-succinylbenzoate synthase [Leucobacter aridicollis]|uniref:o-succinylbenzoate synthase n=1 Tax=Leucobacter aridicollis TaxID=283878 RepID=UPI000E64BC02|nr:o-succinylbenzoate synthase [Leucobacter aridicollis]UTX53320.1 o-succinylbenzoate synthase [Leucobacter aridicollis]